MKRNRIRAALVLAAALFYAATPVLAHANLVRSDPAANSAQKTPPPSVRLWFSEDVEPSFSSLRVLDKTGMAVDRGNSHRMSDDPKGLEVSLGDVPEGLYTVAWKVTSAVDGHVTTGSFSFTIGAVPLSQSSPREVISLVDAALAADAPPPLYQVIVRWLNLLLLVLLAGSLAFPLLVLLPAQRAVQNSDSLPRNYADYARALFGPAPSQRISHPASWETRWLSTARLFLVLDALVTVITLFAQAYAVGGRLDAAGQILISTRFGIIWLLRVAILIALAIALWRPRGYGTADARAGRSLFIAALLGVLLLVTQSLNSHGAATANPPLLPFFVDLVHLLGVAIWVGGLVQLLVTLPAFLRSLAGAQQMRGLARVIAAFSLVAFLTVGMVILTGAYSLLVQVGSLEAFFSTLYGTALLAKLLLILPLLALGALNLIITRPAAARAAAGRVGPLVRRFDLAVALEVILAGGVLLAVGLVTSVAPAKSVYNPAPPVWLETRRVEDLNLTLGVAPGLVGTNDFDVKVQDAAGHPVSNAAVVRVAGNMKDMEMGAQEVTAANQGDGHYTFHGDLMSMVGTWQFQVLVRRLGVEDVRANFSLLALGQRLSPTASPVLAVPQAQAGLGLTLFGFALGTAAVLLLAQRRARWAIMGGALTVSLLGALVVYQVSATTSTAAAFVVPTVPEVARLTRSPIAPVPAQIAAGQQVYLQNCATCHGTGGKGDGPSAAALTPRPADLTVHARQHTEGELYWWVTHGIATTGMPAWDSRLSDLERWQVVQYIRTLGANSAPAASGNPTR